MTAGEFTEALKRAGVVVRVIEHDVFGGLALLPVAEPTDTMRRVFFMTARKHGLRVTSKHIVWKVNGLEAGDGMGWRLGMDPNTNLKSQNDILQARIDSAKANDRAPGRQQRGELIQLRLDLSSWLHSGGFEPNWDEYPLAASYWRLMRKSLARRNK